MAGTDRSPAADGVVATAADGLVATVDDDGRLRIGWGETDWFGPASVDIGPPVDGRDDLGPFAGVELVPRGAPDGVVGHLRAYADEPLLVLRLEAARPLIDLATGTFSDPSLAWRFRPADRRADGVADGTRGFGHQYTEFALPTTSDASLARWFLLPHRPPVVEPMWLLAPDGRSLLLAPLDAFHDQITSVADGVACGWHGDLDEVPAGFTTEVAIWAGHGSRRPLERHCALLRRRAGTARPPRDADALGARLSYWTDNGAAYWYRTEPDHDVEGTLSATVDDLRQRGIPVDAVQLDSWFYPHEVLRPFDTDDWIVPPTGLMRWEPRDDVLPAGIPSLRKALGGPPLVAHIRHLSSSSPHLADHECWVDGDRAHPVGPALYERWLDDCLDWGVQTFEHDWLVECWQGVRGLRAGPGRARAWQEGIDRAAAERGITLQWCMASPADFLQTTTLAQVTSIRTCGDHGYLVGPGVLWTWFLHVGALARALGLRPFKDVFRSDTAVVGHHAEVEALLSALSTGPVGVGDPLGRADPAIVRRTCRADGTLVAPDEAVAAIDRCFFAHPVTRAVPLVGEAVTDHPAGRWTYVVAINCFRGDQRLQDRIDLGDLGDAAPTGPVVVWDWRLGEVHRLEPGGALEVDLEPLDWTLRVLAPVLDGGLAVVGDPELYATAGVQRIGAVTAVDGGVTFAVLGAGEHVRVVGWASTEPSGADGGGQPLAVDWDVASGRWELGVEVPASGSVEVELRAGVS